jgi:3-phosphoshikimate 1-carboxyvinyltransferase
MRRSIITPSSLSGKVTPPPSKSAAHRAIICASLAHGISTISPFVPSNDMTASIGAMRALSAKIDISGNTLIIDGSNTFSNILNDINCLESGSTLRFLIPIAATSGAEITFTGEGLLPERPIGPYLDSLPKAGVECVTQGGLPLTISGKLKSGIFTLPGDVSSQFITGLLLALPLIEGNSEIRLTSPLQSASYIDLTMDVMSLYGISIETANESYFVKGGQKYTPCNYKIEGDWSQAAFWLVAGALGCDITCEGLNTTSRQGDREILNILNRFGAKIISGNNSITVQKVQLKGCEIDASQIPDLVPIIAVLGSLSEGRTVIKNAARLRIKECDRLHAMALGLTAFGADIKELDDGLIIEGKGCLLGGEADSFNDHRIAMALSIAALFCKEQVIINDSGCVNKSYPEFFTDFNKLGGNADVVNMG